MNKLVNRTSKSGLFKWIATVFGNVFPWSILLEHPNCHVEQRFKIVSTADLVAKHIVDTGKAHRASQWLFGHIVNVFEGFIVAIRFGEAKI